MGAAILVVLAVGLLGLVLWHGIRALELAVVARQLARAPSGEVAFDELALAGLPEQARAYLQHGLTPGTPIYRSAELQLRGAIGRMPFHARLRVTPESGGLLQASVAPRGGLWLRWVSYRVVNGDGATALMLWGVLPMWGRGLHLLRAWAESLLGMAPVFVPSALLPAAGCRWAATDSGHVMAVLQSATADRRWELAVGAEGDLLWVRELHDETGSPAVRLAVEEEARWAGMMLPSRIRMISWPPCTEGALPDLQARITAVRFG